MTATKLLILKIGPPGKTKAWPFQLVLTPKGQKFKRKMDNLQSPNNFHSLKTKAKTTFYIIIEGKKTTFRIVSVGDSLRWQSHCCIWPGSTSSSSHSRTSPGSAGCKQCSGLRTRTDPGKLTRKCSTVPYSCSTLTDNHLWRPTLPRTNNQYCH